MYSPHKMNVSHSHVLSFELVGAIESVWMRKQTRD